LKNLVSELFELSRLEAREKKPSPEAFSIAELVQDIQQKNLVIAEPKNISLKLEFQPDLPLVYADIGMMEKVLQNLLDNAVKFTDEHGTVTITMQRDGNCVVIGLSDTGTGISKDELPHIFDRYQQADRGEKDDNRGLGLGLAIVKKILEVHGIDIEVQSKEGVGTTFTFRVPVYEAGYKKEAEKKLVNK
jgi:signal transduction histidine kinase